MIKSIQEKDHINITRLLRIILGIIIIIILSGRISFSQNISGNILTYYGNDPIVNCNIRINGTVNGTSSDSEGNFIIRSNNFPITLVVSHVGFKSQYLKLDKPQTDLKIYLEREIYLLDTITVSANPVVNIVKDKPLYIWDYEFFEDKIIVLAFLNNSMFKPRLILLNYDGDTLCVKPVKKARRLYKDCLDNVHLISTDEVHQIYYDSKDLIFAHTYPISVIDSVLNPCVEFLNGYFYVSKYYYDNQVVRYYFVDNTTMEYEVLATISDSLGLVHLFDEERFAGMGGYNEFDKRFAKMFFFNPVFAPLAKIDSTICIFNYSNNILEKYNDKGECIDIVDIYYHKNKNWKEEILIDDILGRVYTLFLRNGVLTLYEIDTESGQIGDPISIPNFAFVEKCKVNDGFLYFLYKEKSFVEYKKLYRMRI